MQIAGNSSDLAVISVLSLPQLSHYNYNSVGMVVAGGVLLRTSYTQAISCARGNLANLVIRHIDAIDLHRRCFS